MTLALLALVACGGTDEKPTAPPPSKIRVAVVGGMIETGFWQALAERYQQLTGHTVELVASGPKPVVIEAFKKGGIDLITVHASDAMVNLVADGLAVDPQPWVRNDMVIVGPTSDPAGIRGEKDAVAALQKIAAAKAKVLIHASNGADGVLHDLRELARVQLDAIAFDGESQHAVLKKAAEAGAYTLVGRIPMLTGKLKHDGIVIMVRGDARVRRPYLVEVAPAASAATRDLAAYLRSADVQKWIATYGKGKYDDDPLFFPVN